jgi:hypothetical protein
MWLEQGLGTYLWALLLKPCISLSGVEFLAGMTCTNEITEPHWLGSGGGEGEANGGRFAPALSIIAPFMGPCGAIRKKTQ